MRRRACRCTARHQRRFFYLFFILGIQTASAEELIPFARFSHRVITARGRAGKLHTLGGVKRSPHVFLLYCSRSICIFFRTEKSPFFVLFFSKPHRPHTSEICIWHYNIARFWPIQHGRFPKLIADFLSLYFYRFLVKLSWVNFFTFLNNKYKNNDNFIKIKLPANREIYKNY